MGRTITAIPATINYFTDAPINSVTKRRVAGYARVSTDDSEQLISYENQVKYYTNYIQTRPDWEFAGLYTDEGITGTNTKQRQGFNRMIEDALNGKIDLIVTKSVSRFARNTVDSLTMIRKLKENGVEVFFEKENIWTMDSKGELLLTIMSSLAQEESRSISENVKWGMRKNFADGKVSVAYKTFLGYEKGPNGKMVVNEEQAKVVRLIYQMFINGATYAGIASELESQGIKTAGGRTRWHASTIRSILRNEKYKGDSLLQKRFTVDFLSKKQKKNEGELPQYYVAGDHEAIISPATFDLVQKEISRRRHNGNQYFGDSIFSAKIKCGECGSWYGPKTWHSTKPNRKRVLMCNGRTMHKVKCHTPAISPELVKELFINSVNKLLLNKEGTIHEINDIIQNNCNTAELLEKQAKYEAKLQQFVEKSEKIVELNSQAVLEQEKYRKAYEKLTKQYATAKKQYDKLDKAIFEKDVRRERLTFLKEKLNGLEIQTEFNERLWRDLIDYLTVYSKKNIVVRFIGGIEV